MPFAQHYQETLEELARVCASCGRDPREVKVIAVSKTVDAPAISAAIAAGAHDFGENRPDVLAAKVAQLPEQTWHFIGNVQSRKIPEIVACATLVHSVCKEDHFAKFDQAAERFGKVLGRKAKAVSPRTRRSMRCRLPRRSPASPFAVL